MIGYSPSLLLGLGEDVDGTRIETMALDQTPKASLITDFLCLCFEAPERIGLSTVCTERCRRIEISHAA